MPQLVQIIERLGHALVACTRSCDGIVCSRGTGRIPRCLFLDVEGRSSTRGAAVVGLNPGRSSERERRYYLDRGCGYDSVVAWFQQRKREHRQCGRRGSGKLRLLLGLGGGILLEHGS